MFVVDSVVTINRGGVERVTYLLAKDFIKRGHKVSVLSVANIKEEDKTTLDLSHIFLPASTPDFKRKLDDLLRENNIDTVILQGVYTRILFTLQSLSSDVKSILVLHDKPYHYYGNERKILGLTPWGDLELKFKIMKAVAIISPALHRYIITKRMGNAYRRITQKADRFMLLSKRFEKAILDLTPGIDHNKLYAINNPNTFTPSPYEDINKENLVIFVGRLSNPQKNLFDFIRVWKAFHQKKSNWKAIVIGDGEHRNRIEKFAKKHKIENLTFAGNKRNISEYYKKAKMMCLTSTYEGQPMVLSEALAHGCIPFVFNTYESVYDIITPGKNGVIVKAYDVQEMAKQMDMLARDDKRFEEMSMVARKSIRKFEIEKITDQWEELLMTL